MQSFEVIIADDCSDDNTAEIAKVLADPWKGIHYVRTSQNGGTSVACNTAIRKAIAPIIARIDGDDMREPFALKAMYDLQKGNMHSFIYDDCVVLSPNGRGSKSWKMKEYDYDELIFKNSVHAGIMFPKKAWEEVGGYPEEMRWGRDDWAFNVALGLKGWCGVHCHEAGYIYRRHGNNRTLRNTTPSQRAAFLEQIKKLYPEAYSKERSKMCCGNRVGPQSGTTFAANGGGGTYAMPITEGSQGAVILEYQGGNFGKETYYGPVTGTPYTFSVKHKRRLVDSRDLRYSTPGGQKIGLLDLVDQGKDVFRRVKEAQPKKVAAVAPEPVAKTPVVDTTPEIDKVTEAEVGLDELDEIYVADLVKIRGVGKKTAEALVSAGYLSDEHILEASIDQLMQDLEWTYSRTAGLKNAVKDHVGS